MPNITSNYIEVHISHVENGVHKFLLLKRADENKIYPGIWQMVTGGIEHDEVTVDAVKRELLEETGLKPQKLFVVPKINSFYFPTSDKIVLSPVFLAIVNTTDVKISEEHSEYKWVSFDEAVDLIYWPNQVESLTIIKKQFEDKELYKKMVEMDI
jgi:dATP pyrophosphohydrolase